MSGDGVKTDHRLKDMLKEPSTWAALAAAGAVLTGKDPAKASQVAGGLVDAALSGANPAILLAAVLGAILPERKG